jgi:type IV pilus assembly protein PilA
MVERPTYSLPTIALALSIGGLCLCLSSLAGIVLGIIALARIGREPQLPGRGRAIAAIVVGVGVIPFQLGFLAAIAIPNFIRYQARSKQIECKLSLRELWNDEQAYRADHGHYATRFTDLRFQARPRNRYAYVLSQSEVIPVDPRYRTDFDPVAAVRSFGVGVKDDAFVAACVGNIDNDPTLDVWTVSSDDRTVPAGTPRNEVNDVVE